MGLYTFSYQFTQGWEIADLLTVSHCTQHVRCGYYANINCGEDNDIRHAAELQLVLSEVQTVKLETKCDLIRIMFYY